MKTEQYKSEYCQMLIEHMMNGLSFSSFGKKIGHGRTTLYDWLNKHSDFKEAYEKGYCESLYFHEVILNAKIRGKDLSNLEIKKADTACLIFKLKTVFRKEYSEKHEIEMSVPNEIKLAYNND